MGSLQGHLVERIDMGRVVVSEGDRVVMGSVRCHVVDSRWVHEMRRLMNTEKAQKKRQLLGNVATFFFLRDRPKKTSPPYLYLG